MMAPEEPDAGEGGRGGGRHFLDVSPRIAMPPPLPGSSPARGSLTAPPRRPLAHGRPVAAVTARRPMRPRHAGRTRIPDPGSPRWGLIALLAALVLVPIVIVVQQAALAKIESDWRAEEKKAGPDGPISPPGFDQFTIATKALVKMNEAMRPEGQSGPWSDDAMAGGMLDAYAVTLPDEVRLAIVKGELKGAEAALTQLEQTERFVEHQGTLAEDIATLEALYRDGAAALPEEKRMGLVERHGWYGEVALTFGEPKTDEARQELLSGGWTFLWSMLFIMLVLGAGFITALALDLMMLIKILSSQVRLRLEMPAPGGSVYLETFAVFMAAFLALMAISTVVESNGGRMAEWALLLGPWAIAPAVLWPLLRGVPWKRFRADVGWHRGEGLFKEIGCGVAGYLASVPMYVAVVFVMVVFETIRRSITGDLYETPPPGELPIDLSGEDRWLMLAALMSLLTLWAPLVEETVFRGALMRHLTSRLHWLAAALITAIIFGAIHPYPVIGIVPVAFLGYVFGIMRRWRGSLIAPITAHALHNGTVGTILVVIMLLVSE